MKHSLSRPPDGRARWRGKGFLNMESACLPTPIAQFRKTPSKPRARFSMLPVIH